MAVRVTSAEVAKIIDTDSSTDIDAFIGIATLIVDEELDNTAVGHTVARLKDIERYLTAHFIAFSNREHEAQEVRLGAAGVSRRFDFKKDMGLNNTTYGQTALFLDTSGVLATLDETDSPAVVMDNVDPVLDA